MIPSFSPRGLGLYASWNDDQLESVREAGFRAVDLQILDLLRSGVSPESLARRLEANDLRIGACPLPCDWRGDVDVFERSMNAIPEILDYAASLGVTRLYTRVSETLPTGVSRDTLFRIHVDRLHRIAEILEPARIMLGLEAVGVESFRHGKPAFLDRLASVRDTLAEVIAAHPHIGLLVDAFHLHAAGESAEVALGTLQADRVIGVHVADLPEPVNSRSEIVDNCRALPETTGQVPVREVLKALHVRGCTAPVIVETLSLPASLVDAPWSDVVRKVAESLRRTWP